MTRLISLVIGSNLSHSPINHSKDAKKRLENDPVTELTTRYSWVKSWLFNRKITQNLPKKMSRNSVTFWLRN